MSDLSIKVLVVGKGRCLVRMTENAAEAFTEAGCDTAVFPTNGRDALHKLCYKLRGRVGGDRHQVIARDLYRKVRSFQPDLVLFVLGAWLPKPYFEAVEAARPEAVRAAWVADLFTEADGVFADYMQRIFCTDSYFIQLLQSRRCKAPAGYLPLAMSPRRFFPRELPRADRIVYVAQNTPGRARFVSEVRSPLTLYGRKWRSLQAPRHQVVARNISVDELPAVYASSLAVLNLKHEGNVVRGLNQRSFEPYGCKTPVLNDDLEDLQRCFQPGREILVYRSVEELQDLCARLHTDRHLARAVGESGFKRVMAEHTYLHRARTVLAEVGMA